MSDPRGAVRASIWLDERSRSCSEQVQAVKVSEISARLCWSCGSDRWTRRVKCEGSAAAFTRAAPHCSCLSMYAWQNKQSWDLRLMGKAEQWMQKCMHREQYFLWEMTCISVSVCLIFNCMILTRAFAFLLYDFQKLSEVFRCWIVQIRFLSSFLKDELHLKIIIKNPVFAVYGDSGLGTFVTFYFSFSLLTLPEMLFSL